MNSPSSPATRLATRLAFLVAGFGMACWAPLVPFARQRLQVGDAVLGMLLLCIGIGSILAMVVAGPVCARAGCKPVILVGGFGLAIVLPLLSIAATPLALGAALLAFGAALGSIDVAMNIQAVEVEKASATPLMSGFHALFSVGGFAGAALMIALLSWQAAPFAGALVCAAIIGATMLIAWPRLLTGAPGGDGPMFVLPRGVVLILAGLAAATFLAEGAMLDWGALFLTDAGLLTARHAGAGYMVFAIAMTAGRLAGDALTARLGDLRMLIWGGIVAIAGFVTLLGARTAPLAMAGFLLIGLGASNIVPALFRKAGSQTAMPAALAIGAMTTTGYAGILVGPAAIGLVADMVGLRTAFWILAGLVAFVPLAARRVAGR